MVRILLAFLLCLPALLNAAAIGAHVSRDKFIDPSTGNDSYPGTVDKPWASGANLGTVTLDPDAIVYIKGGETVYNTSVSFASSGTSGHPIVIKSYGTGRGTLSGGILVTTWTLVDEPNNIWRASYNPPDGESGDVQARAIWVNDKRCVRSRSTSLGTITENSTGWTSTLLASAAFPAEASVRTKLAFWGITELQVTGANGSAFTINSGVKALLEDTQSVWGTAGDGSGAGGNAIPYEIQNVYEIFVSNHTAATFFQDRTNHFLYLVPPAGVSDPNSATVVAGFRENVLTFSNKHDVTIGNIAVKHTTCLRPYSTYNYVSGQAGGCFGSDFDPDTGGAGIWTGTLTTVEAAITVDTGTRIKFDRTLVYGVGGTGIKIKGGSSTVELDGVIVRSAGAACVEIGSPGYMYNVPQTSQPTFAPQPTLVNLHDCILREGGRDFIDVPCLLGWFFDTANITHNTVRDANWCTISLGWGFGMYSDGFLGGDLIEYNEAYNAGNTRLTDVGICYMNGYRETPSEVRNNAFHDIVGTTGTAAGAFGYYNDGGAFQINAHDNIIWNCQDGVWNSNTAVNSTPKNPSRTGSALAGGKRTILINTSADSTATRTDGTDSFNTYTTPTNIGDSACVAAAAALGVGPRASYSDVIAEDAALSP